MINDPDARKAVRLLLDRFESMKAQSMALAYVLAERDPDGYAQLLQAAEKTSVALIQPIINADAKRSQVYSALDDPNADWSTALLSMLNQDQGPIEFDSRAS